MSNHSTSFDIFSFYVSCTGLRPQFRRSRSPYFPSLTGFPESSPLDFFFLHRRRKTISIYPSIKSSKIYDISHQFLTRIWGFRFVSFNIMDELFGGLNCRLRLSGMVADSIMIGIVSSKMEEAYKKVCSKEGDMERLNEKSRFYELALVQLDWSLKFVLEEMETELVGSGLERENLVAGLTETRERIQRHLEETELAITLKDREVNETADNELKLRQALEMKDEEIRSFRSLEGVKDERVREFVLNNRVCGDEERDEDFCELKNSVDQQFQNIKQKLQGGRANFEEGMKILNRSSSDTLRSDPKLELEEGSDSLVDMNYSVKSDEERNEDEFCENEESSEFGVQNYLPRTELNVAFEQMGSDIGILKAMLEAVFEMMDNAINLSKADMMEQKWQWKVEKETLALVFKSFLTDARESLGASNYTRRECIEGDLSTLMNEITCLRQTLEFFLDRNDIQPEGAIGKEVRPPLKISQRDKGISRKRTLSGNFSLDGDKRESNCVVPLQRCGRSDSFLKFEELCSPKDPTIKNKVDFSSNYVAEMIRNHESIIKRKTQEINWLKGDFNREKGSSHFRQDKDILMVMKKIPEVISKLDIIIKEKAKLGATHDDCERVNEKEQNLSNSLSACEEKEHVLKIDVEISNLKQEREDLIVQNMISEEIDRILLKDFVNRLKLELYESYSLERLPIRKMIGDRGAGTNEIVKGIKSTVNLSLEAENDASSPHKVVGKSLLNENVEELNEQNMDRECLRFVNDKSFNLVSCNLDKYLHHLSLSETQLREGSNLGLAPGDWKEACNQMSSPEDVLEDIEGTQCLPDGEKKTDVMKYVLTSLMDFSDVITNFEHTVQEKMFFNFTRLKEVQRELNPLEEHVASLKKKELLYRKAFTRRCYDLQTAEIEVDLLGDEVDFLLGILEKTYRALDRYSPVLQHYFGIMDILKLIRKELYGDASLKPCQQ